MPASVVNLGMICLYDAIASNIAYIIKGHSSVAAVTLTYLFVQAAMQQRTLG